MRTMMIAAAAALAALGSMGATPAAADYAGCNYSIAGRGHSHIFETREDIGPSRLGVTAHELARRRALESWQATVAKECPHFSTSLRRASDKNFDCDAGVGNRDCIFTARPARKGLGWLFAPHVKG